MELHTRRVVEIFKQVLADQDKLKEKGVKTEDENGIEVVAFTSNVGTPNLVRHDIEQMIKELEGEPNEEV